MALTNDDREWITQLLRNNLCACGLDSEEQKRLGHFMGMIRDIGDGSQDKGIENMRVGFAALNRMRHVGEKVGVAIVILIVTALGSGFITAIWLGIKEMAKK